MKSALIPLLMILLLSVLMIVPDVSRVIVFSSDSGTNVDSLETSTASYPPDRVFLNQTFDNETIGGIPNGWYITNPQYGNITVANVGYGGTQRSAMIIDNSSVGNPGPYRYFAEQTKTIGISFSVRPTNNSGNNTVLEIFVDDGNFNGASVIFKDGNIGCRQKNGDIYPLRSYVPDRWYAIKLVLSVPLNRYSIYINEHFEGIAWGFLGNCTELHRLFFNETSGQDSLSLPVAYVDEIFGRQFIEIPGDYSTIQEGVNVAYPYDVVFVRGQRTYYERVNITKSIELIGEDPSSTVIDGSLSTPARAQYDGILILANNVYVHGLTIKSTPLGAGIRVSGSNNRVENNVVTNGLGDGINVIGSNNYLAHNAIRTNLKYGVRISGSNCTLTDNTITENDACGVLISASNCSILDNSIGSNLDCGIRITSMHALVRNNTIRNNALGIQCDATSRNNQIFQNRFIGNNQTPQAVDSGSNQWDDGYPYTPTNKTGGGNYWSDLGAIDIYFGADQKQQYCFLAPDGISDTPYALSPGTKDKYPLFIIQNVTDSTRTDVPGSPCASRYVESGTGITVTATFLRNVTIAAAAILVEYYSVSNTSARFYENRSMGISTPALNTWMGSIPANDTSQSYGMMVAYNVSVMVQGGTQVNSTNYPLSGPFFVDDTVAPTIGQGGWVPLRPDNESLIRVWAIVTEPSSASGVANVSLSYLFEGTVWTAQMTLSGQNNFTAVMPKQPGNTTVLYTITAIDKAGNSRDNNTGAGIPIVFVPELSVNNTFTSQEPCDIDLGVMYRGEKKSDSRLTLANKGGEPMSWTIVPVSGEGVSIVPPSGVILPGRSATVNLTVDTVYAVDPNLYVFEFTVVANGSVPRWVVLLRFIVRDIVIDASWCSKSAPLRSNINENVGFAFHAKWTHNCSDAVFGNLAVTGDSTPRAVNSSGWIIFTTSLPSPGSKSFGVTSVDFTYTKDNQTYHIKSFTQRAENLTAIWDRVKLVLTLADDRIDVNSEADITWDSSVYEYDNSPFVGTAYLNDTLTKATVGRYCITASSINDTKYGLTAFQTNSVFCVWDRFKINVGGVSNKQTQVGKAETVWFMALYEYDNMVFKGGNGTMYIDVYVLMFDGTTQSWTWVWNQTDAMDFSYLYDRWEKTYSFDTSGPRAFTVSQKQPIEDRLYNLTAFNDLVVPTLDITWYGGWWPPWPNPLPTLQGNNSNSTEPSPTQSSLEFPPWAFVAIIVTLVIGLTLIFGTILLSAKRNNHKIINGKMKVRARKTDI